MKLNVQLFAAAQEVAGRSPVELSLKETATVRELRAELVRAVPALFPLSTSLLVAVNNEYADDDRVLESGDEVACFPPVSGG